VTALSELGFYMLAGGARDPRRLIDEVREGEALGLGTVFISERLSTKEAATLSGAAAAASSRIAIATAATNHNTRHPQVTAAYAMTMHRLTAGRFTLGLGRGIPAFFDAIAVPRITTAQVEDFCGLMRRLWGGETIYDHIGPAGRFPVLSLGGGLDAEIPLGWVAFGPNSLRLGGRVFDAVILHTFFTEATVERAVRTIRGAAERAGRDPAAVRIWSVLATIGDHLPADVRLMKTVGRMATYLQAYGDLLVATNGWDPAVLARFRADPFVSRFAGPFDAAATIAELDHLATLIPEEWLAVAATGSPDQCVATVRRQFALGADGVVLHGASPAELRPILDAYALCT
jgi:probable F420-dependent oxidoreductase